MNNGGAADERAEETDHEVDGMIGGENAEVTKTWSERVQRGEGDALLKIVFVGHHTAFGAAAGAGGVDDGGQVCALTRNEGWFATVAEFFPSVRAGQIGICRNFGHKDCL